MENNILDKVNESFKGVNDKLSDLKTTIIDDKLEQLQVSSTLPKIIEKLNNLLHINFLGLGTTGSLLGISVFDMQKKLSTSKTGKILNTILKKYGGIEGLHKTYITNTLTTCFADEPQKREVISSLYTTYATDKQQHFSSDIISDVDSLNQVCNLGLQTDTPDIIKNKLPPVKYSYLSQTIYNRIEDKKQLLDPSVLQTLGCVVPTKTGPNNTFIIDTASKDWDPTSITPTIIDAYIQKTTKEFVSTPGFIENIASADHFVLALMGGLFIQGNTFAEAILLGTHTLKDFETSPLPSTNKEIVNQGIPTILDIENTKITQELDKYNDCPLSVDMIIASAKKYTIPVSYIMSIMKNDSGYGTTGVAVKTHNPGNVGNMDDNSTKDRGTWEKGVDAVAENLKKRVDAYHKLFGTQQYPTLKELTSGKHATTGEKFFGVYMTASKGPDRVENFQKELIQQPENYVA